MSMLSFSQWRKQEGYLSRDEIICLMAGMPDEEIEKALNEIAEGYENYCAEYDEEE